ncbi:MAG: ATP-binding protein [Patescibacteria group bacterium]
MNEDDRKAEGRFKAKLLIEQVTEQIAVLMRGIKIDSSGFDPELRLPDGKFVEWSTIFQNVLVNAVNAMLDSNKRQIYVSSRKRGRFHEILIQDTGAGIDIGTSEKLFEPFERQSKISRERQQLGLGGTGIGLTIVRMIAENRNCKVSFVEPDKGFKTAFSLSWSETK